MSFYCLEFDTSVFIDIRSETGAYPYAIESNELNTKKKFIPTKTHTKVLDTLLHKKLNIYVQIITNIKVIIPFIKVAPVVAIRLIIIYNAVAIIIKDDNKR